MFFIRFINKGNLILIYENIPTEDIPYYHSHNIEYLTIKIKINPKITIEAALPKSKISDLDNIIPPHDASYFLIGGDFNAKYYLWNNLNRNVNASAIKNQTKLNNRYT